MPTGSNFDSGKQGLIGILENVRDGAIQLPDFQRGWVWDDEHIRSLLASVAESFPIGAIMLLETGGEGVRFKPRPVEGSDATVVGARHPDSLILDGQQRITSLFQALMSDQAVATRDSKKKAIKRWYYFTMERALEDEFDGDDLVVGLGEERLAKDFRGNVLLDLSTAEREYEQLMFPVNQVRNCAAWRRGFNRFWEHDARKADLFDAFEERIVEAFKQYMIPVIELKKGTPKEAVCLVFEKVNTGGVPLNVFELLTASFAAEQEGFNLREDYAERIKPLQQRHPVLRSLQSDDYLQAITLLATRKRRIDMQEAGDSDERLPAISCKRKDILKLSLEDYRTWADEVGAGLERAARFLFQQRIFSERDLPYRTQLVPLAAIMATLGADAEVEGVRQHVARWYWCGVLGELYGGAIETRFAKDLPEVVAWVRDSAGDPTTIGDSNFAPSRLLSLRTRNSAAYKGIYALLIRDGAVDFRTGDPIDHQVYFDDKVDIHHVFPRKWCSANDIDERIADCIVNKTPLSARTNRTIGGRAPSQYLATLEKQDAGLRDGRLGEILRSHVIVEDHLRRDDFESFFAERSEAILARIERATGKRIPREQLAEDPDAEGTDESGAWDDTESDAAS
jgi:hypothetical protein